MNDIAIARIDRIECIYGYASIAGVRTHTHNIKQVTVR